VPEYATVPCPEGNQPDRRFERIIGHSAALESVLEQVEQVASTDSTVLIEGETGTGKELIANAIHNASQRCGCAFIKLNCAAIPLDLLESELFGHEKGAFTGAIAQKIGRFEMADEGTLFLDEVGDIPPALATEVAACVARAGIRAFRERSHAQSGCPAGIRDQSGSPQDGRSRSISQ
jgi:transcriptional regulator with GAF, ATPase, and Fis domain